MNWSPIPNSTYEASTDGQIRRVGGKPLAQQTVRGYRYVKLRLADRSMMFRVHRLVCLAFNGPKPTGATCVRHLNGDKLDNRPGNLRWGTDKENAADTILHGRQVSGFDHPNMAITRSEVVEIRERYQEHMVGRIKAANGFILGLCADHPHLTYKTVYRAATGGYDALVAAAG